MADAWLPFGNVPACYFAQVGNVPVHCLAATTHIAAVWLPFGSSIGLCLLQFENAHGRSLTAIRERLLPLFACDSGTPLNPAVAHPQFGTISGRCIDVVQCRRGPTNQVP